MKKTFARIFRFKRMYLLLLAPLAGLMVLLARLDPRWVEAFFVPYFYKPVSGVVGHLTSLLPFSVTEWLAVMCILGLISYLAALTVKICKKPAAYRHVLYKLFINALCVVSAALFLFELCMGLNYYRKPAESFLQLDVHDSTVDELYMLTQTLAVDMNTYRAQMSEDGNGVAILSDSSRFDTSISARDAYNSLSVKYPFLKAENIRNKPLVSSKLFSAFLTTGIYIPFTFESNINIDVAQYTIPATMCHELTHFRGFMRENEANFLGYLACRESERIDFKYSGAMLAFTYCYPRLSQADKELAVQVAQSLSDEVLRDIAYEDAYWEKYRKTVTAQVSDKVYDSYLQANNQPSGIQSYGEMVDLLLAYQRSGAE